MRLLADSGSTKTDWRLLADDQSSRQLSTDGINPYFETTEAIVEKLNHQLTPSLEAEQVIDIHYFGTGCNSPASCGTVADALRTIFPALQTVEVDSDMVGAARGAGGHEPGIVCILGTGSNACYYDGRQITRSAQSLGFWLGDEGSGGYLGKTLVRDFFQQRLPDDLLTLFDERYQLDRPTLLENAYRKPFPNRYFAAFTPFLSDNIDHPYVQNLVSDAFRQFLTIYVCKFPEHKLWPIHFVGSVAFYFSTQLIQAVQEVGCQMGRLLKSPGNGLVEYYTTKAKL